MIWVAVGAAALVVVAVAALLIFLKNQRGESGKSRRDISISEKGVDIRSGQLGGGSSYLDGMPGERIPTMLMEGYADDWNYGREQSNIVLRDSANGNIYCVSFTRELLIGRKAPQQENVPFLKIQDPAVSGNHCRILTDGTGFWIEDLYSTNGTYVNGQRIYGSAPIYGGTAVKIGSSEYIFEIR